MTYPIRHVAVEIARQKREEALDRLARAKARGDTKAISKAQFLADQATLQAVRAEVAAGVVP